MDNTASVVRTQVHYKALVLELGLELELELEHIRPLVSAQVCRLVCKLVSVWVYNNMALAWYKLLAYDSNTVHQHN